MTKQKLTLCDTFHMDPELSRALSKIISPYRFKSVHDYIDDAYYDEGEILNFSESHLVTSNQMAQIRTYFPDTWLWLELTNIRLILMRISFFFSLHSQNLRCMLPYSLHTAPSSTEFTKLFERLAK